MLYTDLHTHGIAGRDSRSEEPEDYLRLASDYLRCGTGAFLPTLYPGPAERMRAELRAIRRAMELQGPAPEGARILGAHMEGPFVNPAKCGALDASSFMRPDTDALRRLTDGFEAVVRIITVAPELPGALKVIENAAGLGIRVNMGHSAATYEQASEGALAGASCVTHIFNAMSGLHHREPGLAGYALLDDGLYVELIADMAHVHPRAVQLVLRCKPADRVILVSDSLAGAKTREHPDKGPIYMPDGATLAGGGISLAAAVENLVSIGVPEASARASASTNPAGYLAGA